MVLSVTVQSLFGPAAAAAGGGGGGGGKVPSADPLPRSTNCLLMSSTGCCAAHHRWLKFNSNPPLCKLLNFKCRPFDYVVSSAPNKNGRHPQIDSCQRELLLSAVSKLGTKATDAGSPAHLLLICPKTFHVLTFVAAGASLCKHPCRCVIIFCRSLNLVFTSPFDQHPGRLPSAVSCILC